MIPGSATTNASGRYAIAARAARPGSVPSCEFLKLFIENYENSTELSAPIRCEAGVQTIDLTTFELILH